MNAQLTSQKIHKNKSLIVLFLCAFIFVIGIILYQWIDFDRLGSSFKLTEDKGQIVEVKNLSYKEEQFECITEIKYSAQNIKKFDYSTDYDDGLQAVFEQCLPL